MENSTKGEAPVIRRMVAYQRAGREKVGQIMTAATRGKAPPPEQKIATAPPSAGFSPPMRVQANPGAIRVSATGNNESAGAGLPPRPRFKPDLQRAGIQPRTPQSAQVRPVQRMPVTTSIGPGGQPDVRTVPVNIKLPSTGRITPPGEYGTTRKENKNPGWPIAVHLASYSSRKNAERGWRQLVSRNSDLLGALRPDFQKVKVEGRGTFYRLRAQPLPTRNAASELCRTLKARGAYCRVSGP